jgi:MFS superfamily sulfate permease-like transporter
MEGAPTTKEGDANAAPAASATPDASGGSSAAGASAPPPPARPVDVVARSARALFATPREDLLAGTVVFLVALPLCLGIAVASNAPPIAGVVAGIVGGLIIPIVSRAKLSVSGPAAGLTAIVVAGVNDLKSFSALAAAVFIAGLAQIVFGIVRAGALAAIVPASVIKAMLSAIGVILIIQQLSIVLGVSSEMLDVDFLVLAANRGDNIMTMLRAIRPGAVLIAGFSFAVIALWPKSPHARLAWLRAIPSSLAVVILGTALSEVFHAFVPALAVPADRLINLPSLLDPSTALQGADFSALRTTKAWTIGVTIALVATIESLLSIEALDRITGQRTPRNREMIAHGIANAISGFLGGLPITAVIVRSTANLQAGAKSKLSAIFHGLLLLVAVVALAPLLNHVPIACLAAILLHVGMKLASPKVLREELRQGYESWVPFLVTLVAVVATDLLRGVLFGFLVSMLVVLKHATRDTVVMKRDGSTVYVDFLRDATFLVKPALVTILDDVREHERVIIDCANTMIDADVREVITTFAADAPGRGIVCEIRGL